MHDFGWKQKPLNRMGYCHLMGMILFTTARYYRDTSHLHSINLPPFQWMKFLCASEIIPVWRYPQLSLEVPGWAVMWAACAQCCGQLQTLCRLAGKFGWEGRAWASQTLHVLRVHSRSGNPCGNHKTSPSSSQFRLSLAQGCAQCNFYCFQGSRFSISLSPKFDHPHGEICLVH